MVIADSLPQPLCLHLQPKLLTPSNDLILKTLLFERAFISLHLTVLVTMHYSDICTARWTTLLETCANIRFIYLLLFIYFIWLFLHQAYWWFDVKITCVKHSVTDSSSTETTVHLHVGRLRAWLLLHGWQRKQHQPLKRELKARQVGIAVERDGPRHHIKRTMFTDAGTSRIMLICFFVCTCVHGTHYQKKSAALKPCIVSKHSEEWTLQK